jgi:hypothetical protein
MLKKRPVRICASYQKLGPPKLSSTKHRFKEDGHSIFKLVGLLHGGCGVCDRGHRIAVVIGRRRGVVVSGCLDEDGSSARAGEAGDDVIYSVGYCLGGVELIAG